MCASVRKTERERENVVVVVVVDVNVAVVETLLFVLIHFEADRP